MDYRELVRGAVVLVNWPPDKGRHNAIVLSPATPDSCRMAVSTSNEYGNECPPEIFVAIDWSAHPYSAMCAGWPSGFGVSYYYAFNASDVPAHAWIERVGRIRDKKVVVSIAQAIKTYDDWDVA